MIKPETLRIIADTDFASARNKWLDEWVKTECERAQSAINAGLRRNDMAAVLAANAIMDILVKLRQTAEEKQKDAVAEARLQESAGSAMDSGGGVPGGAGRNGQGDRCVDSYAEMYVVPGHRRQHLGYTVAVTAPPPRQERGGRGYR